MRKRTFLSTVVVLLCGLILALPAVAKEKKKDKKAPATNEKGDEAEAKWVPAVEPKPLSEKVKRGLGWLTEQQLESGAWGQGEESAAMGGGGQLKDTPSVADTCVAALALIRSGTTPSDGQYARQLLSGVNFVCGQIEESDKDSLFITDTRGTRVQSKLGPYIDTFLASMLLSEVQKQMPDKKANKRVSDALDKVLAKMEKNQRADGTWDDRGWAATIAQGMAVKGLNRAAQGGKAVPQPVLRLAEENSRKAFDRKSGSFTAKGSAGVALYSAGSNLSAVADSVNTNAQREGEVRQQLKEAKTPADRQTAEATLQRFAMARADLQDQQKAVIAKLDDKQFIAGFGSNGGEEFLSYMSIGESLVVKGDDDWKAWDKSITENLNRVQNKDGSWTGHHCITGRTFCTSAALLVLMVDRAPVPIAAKMKRR